MTDRPAVRPEAQGARCRGVRAAVSPAPAVSLRRHHASPRACRRSCASTSVSTTAAKASATPPRCSPRSGSTRTRRSATRRTRTSCASRSSSPPTAYREAPPSTPFDLFADNYRYQLRAGRELGLPPLVAELRQCARRPRRPRRGLSPRRRQLLDGDAQQPAPAWSPHPIIADLGAFDFNAFLAGLAAGARASRRATPSAWSTRSSPPTRRRARASTTACRRRSRKSSPTYGQRCFKLKVGGDRSADLERLVRIAARPRPRSPGRCTSPSTATSSTRTSSRSSNCGSAMEAEPALQKLVRGDALHRAADQARRSRSRAASRRWRGIEPVIIDESDGELDAFVRARALGYGGVSSKDCKGFYKSIVNLARCRLWNAEDGDGALLPVGRGPDDAGRPVGAAGPGAGRPARPRRRRAQRPPLRRRLRRPAAAARAWRSSRRIPTSITRPTGASA